MRRQDTVTLSREAKKEILKVHVSYMRDQLGVYERCYRKGNEKTCDVVIRNLFNSASYLESINVFSVEKYFLLTNIICNYTDRIRTSDVCTV